MIFRKTYFDFCALLTSFLVPDLESIITEDLIDLIFSNLIIVYFASELFFLILFFGIGTPKFFIKPFQNLQIVLFHLYGISKSLIPYFHGIQSELFLLYIK